MRSKNHVFTIICIFLYLVIILLCFVTTLLKNRIDKLTSDFDKDNLYDVNGDIKLDEIKNKKANLEDEITALLKNDVNSDYLTYISNVKDNNSETSKEIDKLYGEVTELSETKKILEAEYNTLNGKYQAMLLARKPINTEQIEKSTVLISNVPTISQYPNYPTGCESVALTLLLRYYGVDVSVDSIISNLSKWDLPYEENGILYGGNPETHFIGSPYNDYSYGVYNNPIADVANIFKEGVTVRTGMPFSEVLALVKSNRPVVVWTSMHLAIPFISNSWIYKPTGQTINWKANEHAVLLVGYNNNEVIISDPLTGTIRHQSKEAFESRYNYYGARAVYY